MRPLLSSVSLSHSTAPRAGALASLMAIVVMLLAPDARADMCEDECDSDEPPCSVEERCPESGVSCLESGEEGDYDQCVADAKAKGLEQRCISESTVFCDPGEETYVAEDGCALRGPKRPARGIEVAAVTLGCAAAAMIARARRRQARQRGAS